MTVPPGQRTVIIDFAHNEAGTEAILDVAAAIAGGAAGRAAPVTAIIGTAGYRPDDTLRGIGRIAATKAQRVAIKETLDYLRGRDRAGIIDAIRAGIAEGGMDPPPCRCTKPRRRPSRRSSSGSNGAASTNGRADAPRVVVLFCHAEREDVFALLERLGARQLDAADGLRDLSPRLADQRRR